MRSGRTHYELLSVEPSASGSAIKSAFREQIARYHPDKVVHLGQEFQDLAAERTAELMVAYRTLIDPALRAQYDAALAARVIPPSNPGPGETGARPEDLSGSRPRFAAERADGDDIVHRALIGRVRSVVTDVYGPADCPRVRGFELVMVPTAHPPLMRSPLPRVFARLRDVVDAIQVRDACTDASRAGLHVPGSPINVLLFGKQLEREAEIVTACEQLRSGRLPGVPAKTHAVVIDATDWRALFSADSPPALRRFIDRLRR